MSDKLKSYIKGSRRGREVARLEREALNDPFMSDALEGYNSVKDSSIDDLVRIDAEIERRIKFKHRRRLSSKSFKYTRIAVMAASLMLIVAVVTIMSLMTKNNDAEIVSAVEIIALSESESLTDTSKLEAVAVAGIPAEASASPAVKFEATPASSPAASAVKFEVAPASSLLTVVDEVIAASVLESVSNDTQIMSEVVAYSSKEELVAKNREAEVETSFDKSDVAASGARKSSLSASAAMSRRINANIADSCNSANSQFEMGCSVSQQDDPKIKLDVEIKVLTGDSTVVTPSRYAKYLRIWLPVYELKCPVKIYFSFDVDDKGCPVNLEIATADETSASIAETLKEKVLKHCCWGDIKGKSVGLTVRVCLKISDIMICN